MPLLLRKKSEIVLLIHSFCGKTYGEEMGKCGLCYDGVIIQKYIFGFVEIGPDATYMTCPWRLVSSKKLQ